ncbi:MAG: epsilon-lactone hydrolase [Streptosporangiaceae bacterium]|jgi:monoterpene epsilon-lactone hydrolase|nr:Alpha/beta hydrolase fold-3 domain protein [Streptosporangiaceae bacterium]MDX6434261.1 epsilon-lactone hydrolase [Streptosporangiaceae bacterium]
MPPTTPAGRRVAEAIALEPGGPPTLRARAAGQVIRTLVKSIWAYGPPGQAGLLFVRAMTGAVPASPLPRGVEITPEDFGGCTGEWVRAGRPDEKKVLLYLHGGGYFFGNAVLYRGLTWRMSAATARPVLALDYRLAPEHTPADALEDAVTAYDSLLAKGYAGPDIVLGGDSAGGHLTLALLLALKETGRPLPAAAIALSPWADVTCGADSHTLNERTDHLIPAARLAWVGSYLCEGLQETDPLFSPVRGDYAGLPPLLLISSGSEILRDDARRVATRARAAGVRVVHQEWDGLVHVFPMFADFIPEGKAAFRHIAGFLGSVGA